MTSGAMRIRISCAATCMLLAGTADATVRTTTVTKSAFVMVAMPLFDPALGTLMQVYAEATYESSVPYWSSVAQTGYDHAVSGTATLNGLSFTINGASQATQYTGYGVFSIKASGAATWTDATALAALTGTSGSATGSASASAPQPGRLMSGNYLPAVNYTLAYTYDDAPAVPEPATWAMMAGGFAMMGIALRAARRGRTVEASSKA